MLLTKDITALYDGHDAGHYELPAEVLAARGALAELVQRRAEASRTRTATETTARQARSRSVAELVAAAATGAPLPADPAASVLEAEAAYKRAGVALQVLAGAVAASERVVRATLERCTEAVIVQSLRPALAEVVEAVRAAAPELAGLELSNAEAVMATPARVAAYQQVQAAERRQSAIRAGQLGLYRLTTPGRMSGRAEVRNVHKVAPRRYLSGAAELLDLVARGAELWVPTPQELARAESMKWDRTPVKVPSADGPGNRRGRSLVGRRAAAVPAEA